MSNQEYRLNRRQVLKLGLAATAGLSFSPTNLFAQSAMLTRPIPSSGEQLPLVGVGTARRYNVDPNDATAVAPLREVIENIPTLGGKLVDTAPSYGNAETVLGNIFQELQIRDQLFLSSKVRKENFADAKAEIEQSFLKLKTDTIDLMYVHNLVGVNEVLPYLRDLKAEGRIRYYGVSTSFERQHAEFEQVMGREELDFIQVDYAIDNRSSGERIIPLAADRGVAVQANLPFGRGRVFEAFGDQPIPDWAKEFDIESWAQFALKWIVSNPAVNSAMPGTAKLSYLQDNLGASRGRLPDEATRQRMAGLIDSA
jgi:aryl-alcohol dehydrogenase-like predicted oxidoreductase